MQIRKHIDALMARLGYIPARQPAKLDPACIPLKIEVDTAQVSSALALLERINTEAATAEAAIRRLNIEAGTAPACGGCSSGLPG